MDIIFMYIASITRLCIPITREIGTTKQEVVQYFENTFGAGVIESESYEAASIDTFFGGAAMAPVLQVALAK